MKEGRSEGKIDWTMQWWAIEGILVQLNATEQSITETSFKVKQHVKKFKRYLKKNTNFMAISGKKGMCQQVKIGLCTNR